MELDLQIPGSGCLFRQTMSHFRKDWLDSAWKHCSIPYHECTRVTLSGICRNKINKDFFFSCSFGDNISLWIGYTCQRWPFFALKYVWPFPELTRCSLPYWPKHKAKSFSDNSLWKKSNLFCIRCPRHTSQPCGHCQLAQRCGSGPALTAHSPLCGFWVCCSRWGKTQKGWLWLGVLEALWTHCEGICSGSVLTKGSQAFVWSQFVSTSSDASAISKYWCPFYDETARNTLLPLTSNWLTFIFPSCRMFPITVSEGLEASG